MEGGGIGESERKLASLHFQGGARRCEEECDAGDQKALVAFEESDLDSTRKDRPHF
jgi:hypothetical protein